MTKNGKILFDLLIAEGHDVKDVWYEPTFGWLPGGWTAEIMERDDEGDNIEVNYHLGRDFMEAKGQIENKEITKSEP